MRYARHVLLPEIGSAGQARLEAATVGLALEGRAREVARDYLHRAGVEVDGADAVAPAPPVAAGRPELDEAAAFVAGALHAVETIKALVEAGEPHGGQKVVLTGPREDDA
ncbi:MAG: hypothetical protein KC619_09830 [Myxococcales bacterium]|nr:hypothetical protein [Myxococcales bacterium]